MAAGSGLDTRDQTAREAAPANHRRPIRPARRHSPRCQIGHSCTRRHTKARNTNSAFPWPDIRIIDTINNDIEIVSNAEDVLVYDRPTHKGVLWRDLQAWWKDIRAEADDEKAKTTLYKRLRKSLPVSSPPQRNLFDIYHHIYRDELPGLPALLPEVWLHWDPRTIRERGPEALLNFRMDFLLLLPNGHRIVLEVDGATHYSTGGHPDGDRYAKGARADRELKLARYEVFRFGATELQNPASADPMLRRFFADLFQQFGVTPRTV